MIAVPTYQQALNITSPLQCSCRMGHADHEISAAFSRFDRDGNQILDEDEQERMKTELEEKRVCSLHAVINMATSCHFHIFKLSSSLAWQSICFIDIFIEMNSNKAVFCYCFFHYSQDALCSELNNLGMNYGKDLLEKHPATLNDQRNHSGQTFVDREQFLRFNILYLT